MLQQPAPALHATAYRAAEAILSVCKQLASDADGMLLGVAFPGWCSMPRMACPLSVMPSPSRRGPANQRGDAERGQQHRTRRIGSELCRAIGEVFKLQMHSGSARVWCVC